MSARDLIDDIRASWVADTNVSPTREIVYMFGSGAPSISINAFVGGGNFNEIERERIDDFENFSGLNLQSLPQAGIGGDTILYDGVTYKVARYKKLGNLYSVYGERSRHNGRPKA